MDSSVKLHLGCGKRFIPGFFHIDGGNYNHLDKNKGTINDLNFENNSVDIIYASHLIAYFDRHEIIPILKEWYRVLKPGGILRLATPDFKKMMNLYLSNSNNFDLDDFLGPIYGRMEMGDKMIYHKTTYDYESLVKILMQKLKFSTVRLYDWKLTDHSHIDDHSQAYLPKMDKEKGTLISLNIEAVK